MVVSLDLLKLIWDRRRRVFGTATAAATAAASFFRFAFLFFLFFDNLFFSHNSYVSSVPDDVFKLWWNINKKDL